MVIVIGDGDGNGFAIVPPFSHGRHGSDAFVEVLK